jgi:hypothetical protein
MAIIIMMHDDSDGAPILGAMTGNMKTAQRRRRRT